MDSFTTADMMGFLIFLPLVILLIYITLKYGGKYAKKLSQGKLIKVVEKVSLSQNSYIAIVLVDGKPYLMSGGEKGVQILKELDESVAEKIKDSNGQNNKFNFLKGWNINEKKEKL
ncbi:MAG TPA: hypothetical protein DEF85_09170 [Clostridiaceae bacterium]|jgi:flagellar protein FliO/FliZ|nr:hypothetical protein [Clostridiaceae bacterium]HBX49046.1 hypothetical protein [Clostridiaceae bacterium]HCL50578.1 hypothetical protein [Clostridiaceae bacterium]